MSNIPAFPQVLDGIRDKPGMTLRDYFAGQALAGVASDPTADMNNPERAKWAYRMADAMIKARGE